MDVFFTWLGFLAGLLTTLSFVPQALQSWRTRSAGDFSWSWVICFSLGILLWFVYGVYLRSWPMILANAITFCLVVPVVLVKLRNSSDGRASQKLQESIRS